MDLQKPKDMKKIVIFTGAGISSPLGLPTTENFNIKINNSFITLLNQYLSSKKDINKNDIEIILSTIDEFISFEFANQVCERVKKNSSYNTNTTTETYNYYINQAKSALKTLKKKVYAQLSNFNAEDALILYKTFFSSIVEKYQTSKISYITTNYDLSFDKTIEKHYKEFTFIKNLEENFEDYFKKSKLGSSHFEYKPLNTSDSYFEYIKLHGSLDWHKDGDRCIKSGTSTTPDNPENMYILYPGEKLIPEDDPFSSLHHTTFQRMLEADVIIVIGFAFRDKTINYIFSNILKNNKKVEFHVVNPLEIKEFPKDSKFPFFYENFQNQIKYHQELLEIDKKLSFLQ
jgi:hypothetical protein